MIRAFLRRLTRDAALADDLAQVTFIKAYEKQSGLKSLDAAKAWLFKIAYRTFVDHVRKDIRRKELMEGRVEDNPPEAPPGLALDIEEAMNTLAPECRAVVILCLAHGMSHSEAAKATGMPLGTVKSHVNRGKEKLRTFLQAYEKAD